MAAYNQNTKLLVLDYLDADSTSFDELFLPPGGAQLRYAQRKKKSLYVTPSVSLSLYIIGQSI